MLREARIAAGDRTVIGGGDAGQLDVRLEAALRERRSAVVSFGLCGALDPALKPGDLVIGEAALAGSERIDADAGWATRLAAALPSALRGAVVHAAQPIASAVDKARVRAASGAVAVDMESLAAGRAARRWAAPFAILRAVSDGADRTLPPAARVGLGRDGRPAIGPVFGSLVRHPWQTPALIRTAREAETAFRALADAGDLLGPGLGGPDLL
jgi:hopanoid-associated phosphorylase